MQLILTGTNGVERPMIDTKFEVLTQEQLMALDERERRNLSILPARDPGTFLVIRETLIAWTSQPCTNTCHTTPAQMYGNGGSRVLSTALAVSMGVAAGMMIGKN